MNEEFPRKTPFGFLLPRSKVRTLLLSMFDPYVGTFAGSPDVELSDELAIRDRELARWTPLGWRFLAGETWKARSNLWNLVSRSDTLVPKIIQSGWLGT